MFELIGLILAIILLKLVFRTARFFIKIAIMIYILVMMFKYWEVLMSR